MPDNYKILDKQSILTDSVSLLNNNFLTALTSSSGAVFPTTNLTVGRLCYRNDTKSIYILTSEPLSDGSGAIWTKLSAVSGGSAAVNEIIIFNSKDDLPDPYSGDSNKLAVVYGDNCYVDVMIANYAGGTIEGSYDTITGLGTAWEANVVVGDSIIFENDAKIYRIEAVNSDSSLRVDPHVPTGGIPSGTTYTITRKRWLQVIPESEKSENIKYGNVLPLDTSNYTIGDYFILKINDGANKKGFYVFTAQTPNFLNILDVEDAEIDPDQLRLDLLKNINVRAGASYLAVTDSGDVTKSILPNSPIRNFGPTLPDASTYKVGEGFILTAQENTNKPDLYQTITSAPFVAGNSRKDSNNNYYITSVSGTSFMLQRNITSVDFIKSAGIWAGSLEGSNFNLASSVQIYVSLKDAESNILLLEAECTQESSTKVSFPIPSNRQVEVELFLEGLGTTGAAGITDTNPQSFSALGIIPDASGGINDITSAQVRAKLADGIQDKTAVNLIVLDSSNAVGKSPIPAEQTSAQLRTKLVNGIAQVTGTEVLTLSSTDGLGISTLPAIPPSESNEQLRAKIIDGIASISGTEILTIGNNILGKSDLDILTGGVIEGTGSTLPDILNPNYNNDRLFLLDTTYDTNIKGFYGKSSIQYAYKSGFTEETDTNFGSSLTEFTITSSGGLVIEDGIFPVGSIVRAYIPREPEEFRNHEVHLQWGLTRRPTNAERTGIFSFRLHKENGGTYTQIVTNLHEASSNSVEYLYFELTSDQVNEYNSVVGDKTGNFAVYIGEEQPIEWERKNIIPIELTSADIRTKVVDGIPTKEGTRVLVIDTNDELGIDEIPAELTGLEIRTKFAEGIPEIVPSKILVIGADNSVGTINRTSFAGTISVQKTLPDPNTWPQEVLVLAEGSGLYEAQHVIQAPGTGEVAGEGSSLNRLAGKNTGLSSPNDIGAKITVELTADEQRPYRGIGRYVTFTVTAFKPSLVVDATEGMFGSWSYSGYYLPAHFRPYHISELRWVRLSYVPTPEQTREQLVSGIDTTINRGELLTVENGEVKITSAKIGDIEPEEIRTKFADGITNAIPGQYLVIDENNVIGTHELILPDPPKQIFAGYGPDFPSVNDIDEGQVYLLDASSRENLAGFYDKKYLSLLTGDIVYASVFQSYAIQEFTNSDNLNVENLIYHSIRNQDTYFTFTQADNLVTSEPVYILLQNSLDQKILLSGVPTLLRDQKYQILVKPDDTLSVDVFIKNTNFVTEGGAAHMGTQIPYGFNRLNVIPPTINRGIQRVVSTLPARIPEIGVNQFLFYNGPYLKDNALYENAAHIIFSRGGSRPIVDFGGIFGRCTLIDITFLKYRGIPPGLELHVLPERPDLLGNMVPQTNLSANFSLYSLDGKYAHSTEDQIFTNVYFTERVNSPTPPRLIFTLPGTSAGVNLDQWTGIANARNIAITAHDDHSHTPAKLTPLYVQYDEFTGSSPHNINFSGSPVQTLVQQGSLTFSKTVIFDKYDEYVLDVEIGVTSDGTGYTKSPERGSTPISVGLVWQPVKIYITQELMNESSVTGGGRLSFFVNADEENMVRVIKESTFLGFDYIKKEIIKVKGFDPKRMPGYVVGTSFGFKQTEDYGGALALLFWTNRPSGVSGEVTSGGTTVNYSGQIRVRGFTARFK